MTLKAVIFDVDGTLAETEELHRAAFNAAFRAAGLDWEWDRDRYRELLAVEGGLPRLRHYVERHHPRDLARMELEGRLESLHAAKASLFVSMLEEGTGLRPGVARLIEDARSSGLKLAACTTAARDTFEGLILGGLGFEALEWFVAVVTREDLDAVKPDPAPYRLTLERLGLRPDEAIVIEDSARGIAAARGAGLEAVAAPSLYSRGEDFSDALLTVSDLGEPQAPFETLSGDPGRFDCVTADALRVWHARARGGEGAAA
jgi:HAD superfamily hydrolase (TIGR01509 family)